MDVEQRTLLPARKVWSSGVPMEGWDYTEGPGPLYVQRWFPTWRAHPPLDADLHQEAYE